MLRLLPASRGGGPPAQPVVEGLLKLLGRAKSPSVAALRATPPPHRRGDREETLVSPPHVSGEGDREAVEGFWPPLRPAG